MLNQLHVQNFALIEDITLELEKGFNIITGETGAGKSILLGALGLLSGKRAETSVVREGAKKCIIEGEFSIGDYGLDEFFDTNDLDFEEPTLIRREVSSSGKSRAFVNDTPVNLSVLKELGELIIDVHSQHSNLMLNNPEFTYNLLDGFGKQSDEIKEYQIGYSEWIELKSELSDLEEKQNQEKLNLDFNQFQLNELTTAQLKEGEQEELEREFEILNNSEEIKSSSSIVVNSILYNNGSVQELLQDAEAALEKLSAFDESYSENKNRVSSVLIEVKDIAEEVEQKVGSLSSDSFRVDEIDERLSLLFNLQKKFNVASVEQLIEKRLALESAVNLVTGGSEEIEKIKGRIVALESILKKQAKGITQGRKKAAEKIAKLVVEDLKLMGISQAQFQFNFEEASLNKWGSDKIDIQFSANKGKSLGKISKTASGGELSRVMLSLKKIMSLQVALPTIVFDEIDTGVSGEVADQMGLIMKQMGKEIQVLTITHLPQIAAKGNAHYKVFKSHDSELTTSNINKLGKQDRILEIAQMLSGSEITSAAKQNAIELIG